MFLSFLCGVNHPAVFRKTDFTLRSPLTLPFALFSLWAVCGLFFTLDIKNTLHDLRGQLLEYLIIFYLLINYFNSLKKLEILTLIVIVSATIFSFGLVIHYYLIEGFPFSERLGYYTHYIHTNHIGFITIPAITLALNVLLSKKELKSKLFFTVCIIILCVATLLTQSRGSLLGLFIAIVILCFINKRNVLFLAALTLLIVILPGMKERMINECYTKDLRTKINRLTLEVIKEHPITGIGFGEQIYGNRSLINLEKYNNQLTTEFQQKEIINSTHNTILDIAVRTGIVGLVLYLYILFTVVFMLWKSLRQTENAYHKSWLVCLLACFMSFIVSALFENATSGKPAVVHYTILAMIVILWRLVQKDSQPSPKL